MNSNLRKDIMFLAPPSLDEQWLRELKSRSPTLSIQVPPREEHSHSQHDKPDITQAHIPERKMSREQAYQKLLLEYAKPTIVNDSLLQYI